MARRWERRKVAKPLPARNERGENIGALTMLGVKGATVTGPRQFEVGSEFKLQVELPPGIGLGSTFEIMVECRWSRASATGNSFDTGLKFLPSTAQQMTHVGQMLDTLTVP